ncbi:MAG: ShlB/FhaC/HecB family hemolysin secretion/activation protein, partial [Proteobacteria bacterium]
MRVALTPMAALSAAYWADWADAEFIQVRRQPIIEKPNTENAMSSCRQLLLVLGACAIPTGSAYAQTGTPLDDDRVDLNQPVITPETREDAPPPVDDTALSSVEAGEANAAPIQSIQFVGTDVPQVVGLAAEDFIGVPATRENLQALARAMTAAYQKSDVALFTVVVPQQDLSTGNLKVLIGEGFIQTVVLEGEVEGRKLDLVKAYAAKMTGEQSLSRRKMERYLSLIRDIPGLKVQSRLETGQGRGAVRLVLKLDYDKPKLAISYDNRSTRLIDDGQFNLRGSAYGLLREGDATEITAASSVNFRDMLYAGITHSTPIGTEGARLSLSFAHLETRPSDFVVEGNAETYAITFSHPVIRSYKRNLT